MAAGGTLGAHPATSGPPTSFICKTKARSITGRKRVETLAFKLEKSIGCCDARESTHAQLGDIFFVRAQSLESGGFGAFTTLLTTKGHGTAENLAKGMLASRHEQIKREMTKMTI